MRDQARQKRISYAARPKFQLDKLFGWLISGMLLMFAAPLFIDSLVGLGDLRFGWAPDGGCVFLGAIVVLIGVVRVARLPRIV